MMRADTLHVVFCRGDLEALKEALQACGRNDTIVCHDDDLGIGPIDPPDYLRRIDWIAEALDFEGWPATPEEPFPSREDRFHYHPWCARPAGEAAFWTATLGHEGRIVLWLTRRSARNVAGVMEWLRRAGDKPCEIVDFTDVLATPQPDDRKPRYALGLAALFPEEFRVLELLAEARPLDDELRLAWTSRWAHLRRENAPFRIIGPDGAQSAPITTFDADLLACCSISWRKVARVVGERLLASCEGDVHPPSEMVLAARLHALVEAGQLEVQGGDVFAMRFCEVRLPPPRVHGPSTSPGFR
jgi:hypothetical protein